MTLLWTLLTQSRLARGIAWALAGIVLVLTFGKVQMRKGVTTERARRDVADAKKTIQTLEVRNAVEDDVARGGDARDRLRARWRE